MTSEKVVFRIENGVCVGPFNNVDPQTEKTAADAYDKARKIGPSCYALTTFEEDDQLTKALEAEYEKSPGTFTLNRYRSGFSTFKQLNDAFPCKVGRAAMAKQNFVVSVITADEVLEGSSQCVFVPETARKTA